jgi:type I restriction enzyme, S subunit
VALSDLADVRLGRQRSPARAVGPYMRPYMRAANVTWAGINVEDVKEMDFRPDETPAYELRSGDILLAEASGSPSEVGKPAIWRDEIPGACFQNTLIRVRAPAPLVPFLYRHFLNDAISGRFSKASRGVGIHHIGAQALSDWRTLIPPLGEQERIVEVLDSYLTRLDAAVEGLKRVEANLKRYRASVLKAAVEGRLVPTEAELAKTEGRDYEPASNLVVRVLKERRRLWEDVELATMKSEPKNDEWRSRYQEPAAPNTTGLPELPLGWCWARAEQLSGFITKGTTPRPQDMTRGGGEIPYIKVYNLTFDGALDFTVDPTFVAREVHEGALARSMCRPGDVLMNIVGPPLGKVSIVPGDFDAWNINQAVARYRPVPGIDRRYLSLVLRSDFIARWSQRRAKATAGQFNLTLEIARDLPIPVPPEQEQTRIADEEQRLLSLQKSWETTVRTAGERLRRLRQSILKWAFEGKLVDQDPNDEPAAVLLARIKAERAATDGASSRRGQPSTRKKDRAA